MGRAPCCDRGNVKKGPWAPEEDAKLRHHINTHGTGGNWITLPSKAGLRRCGKSCRLRWINYLRPDIKHGSFTEEEEKIIIDLHDKVGSRWSLIAAQLPRRTDNDIKNYWNTRLKKKLAERGMNPRCHQQQHRSYNMRSATGSPYPLRGLSQRDASMRQTQMSRDLLVDHQAYLEQQQRQRGVSRDSIQQYGAFLAQGQRLEQWYEIQQQQMLPVKNELVSHQPLESRVIQIESELIDLIAPPASNVTLGTPHNGDILLQHSPHSPCSGWSSDRSLGGGHVDQDSPYNDNFGICNSYGDPYGEPPALVDVPSFALLPQTTELAALPAQLSNPRTVIQREDSENASSGRPSGGLHSWGFGALPDPASSLFQGVKEELFTDDLRSLTSESISPTTPMGLRNWPVRGDGDLFSTTYQT